jgi:outer membrane protein assembly factor BamB
MECHEQRVLEDSHPGPRPLVVLVWGDRIFLTTAIEGDVIKPGAKGARHVIEGQDFVHPQGVGADRKQTLKVMALDANSGRILWERTAWEGAPYDTRHQRGSFASPTPVTDGKRVYVWFGSEGLYSEDGDTHVIKAGPQHEVLRTNPLGEPIQASPAISQGSLFIRGAQHLYRIRKPAKG